MDLKDNDTITAQLSNYLREGADPLSKLINIIGELPIVAINDDPVDDLINRAVVETIAKEMLPSITRCQIILTICEKFDIGDAAIISELQRAIKAAEDDIRASTERFSK